MIILDTNVISEPMRPSPEATVLQWIDSQPIDTFYFTSISLAELMGGIERLPDGKRKDRLRMIANELTQLLFADRILTFGVPAALKLAKIQSQAAAKGFTIEFADCQIAAMAALHGFSVATRDVVPFTAAGLPVINPWNP
jgi:predicted nucleic acid-binding protein